MNAAANSSVIAIDQVYGFAIEIQAVGGTAAGTFQVQSSMGEGQVGQPGTIAPWSNVGAAITVSSAGSQIINFDAQYGRWARVTFTQSSGGAGDTFTVKYGMKGP